MPHGVLRAFVMTAQVIRARSGRIVALAIGLVSVPIVLEKAIILSFHIDSRAWPALLASMALGVIMAVLLPAGVLFVAAEDADAITASRRAAGVLPRLALVLFVAGLAILLSSAFLVVPGIIAAVRLAWAPLETALSRSSLRRSFVESINRTRGMSVGVGIILLVFLALDVGTRALLLPLISKLEAVVVLGIERFRPLAAVVFVVARSTLTASVESILPLLLFFYLGFPVVRKK